MPIRSPRERQVLLVDDDDDVRAWCGRVLEIAGFDVTSAVEGAEALALVASASYQLVVSDLRMPGADGIRVLAAARDLQPDARRVLMSSVLDRETIERAQREARPDALLEKPLTNEGLANALLVVSSGILGWGPRIELPHRGGPTVGRASGAQAPGAQASGASVK